MTTFIGFRFFSFLRKEFFIWTNLHDIEKKKKKKNKKTKKKTHGTKKLIKGKCMASVLWFGQLHQPAVPGFVFGCLAQLPEGTKSIKILYR